MLKLKYLFLVVPLLLVAALAVFLQFYKVLQVTEVNCSVPAGHNQRVYMCPETVSYDIERK